jgi:2,3,4,5-tetrahydropyridine-2-carboxylate N-succinyltransferase
MTQQLQQTIDAAWEDRANISPKSASKEVIDAVEYVISALNKGEMRVATRESVGKWTVHQWIKKAVLLSFRLKDNELMKAGDLGFYDKVQTKFAHLTAEEMAAPRARRWPGAAASSRRARS